MRIPTGWRDNGTFLTAPNGINLMEDVREFVLAHDWDSDNTPMLEEQYMRTGCDPLDDTSGEGSQTLFRDCMVISQKSSGLTWRISLGPVVGRLHQLVKAARNGDEGFYTLLQMKTLVEDWV